jgi:hypothetical protein
MMNYKSLLHGTGIANTHSFATKPAPTKLSLYLDEEGEKGILESLS